MNSHLLSLERLIDGEIQILKTLRHPNIVQFTSSVKKHDSDYKRFQNSRSPQSSDFILFFKYSTHTNLHSLLSSNYYSEYRNQTTLGFDYTFTIHVLLQLLDAIDYLHGLGILHRHLDTLNIFVSTEPNRLPHIQICPLGHTFTHTYNETAPELYIPNETITNKIDIWDIGIVLYQLLTTQFPVIDYNSNTSAFHSLYPRPPTLFKNVLIECLQFDINNRPDIITLKNIVNLSELSTHHDWFIV